MLNLISYLVVGNYNVVNVILLIVLILITLNVRYLIQECSVIGAQVKGKSGKSKHVK